MKKQFIVYIIGIFGLLFSYGNLQAQKGYRMSVDDRALNGQKGPAFVLEVDRAIEKDVINAWERAIEKNRVKATVQKNLLMVENVVLSSLGEDMSSLYSEVVQHDSSVKLFTIVYVDSIMVDPNGKEGMSIKVKQMLEGFGKDVYEVVLNRELEEKNTVLEELVETRETNLKSQDRLEKSIQQDSLEIGSMETQIIHLNSELELANKKYLKQKNMISNTSFDTKELERQAKATLKDLDKNRMGIEKEIQKQTNEEISIKGQIRDSWYELKQLQADLEQNEESLVKQRKLVRSAEIELQKY